MFLYHLLDMQSMALAPWHEVARATQLVLRHPMNPLAQTPCGPMMAAAAESFALATHTHGKPAFGITRTKFRGEDIDVREVVVKRHPFCDLIHFERGARHPEIAAHTAADPKVLIITPLSGHYATLMRGTVEAMLPTHDVYITDWIDAKLVPLASGFFDLEDQIELLMEHLRLLGGDVHVVAISQASLSLLCAVALMAAQDDPAQPRSMTLIGGPIDVRHSPAFIAQTAREHSLSWFRQNQIQYVPFYYPGALRPVFPGLIQLLDRMAMTCDHHVTEQTKYFHHLVRGDDESTAAHEQFYDEFLSVMDVPAEFYLQLVERAYQRSDLASDSFSWRSERVDPSLIQKTALLTVEGELDDLSPPGSTQAALRLCSGLPPEMKQAHLEIGVGHYGVFSGRKWRNNIQPIIHKFIRTHSLEADVSAAVALTAAPQP